MYEAPSTPPEKPVRPASILFALFSLIVCGWCLFLDIRYGIGGPALVIFPCVMGIVLPFVNLRLIHPRNLLISVIIELVLGANMLYVLAVAMSFVVAT